MHTEADSRVLLPHVVTLLIGEEHVGGQATLGRVGVWGGEKLVGIAFGSQLGGRTLLLLASGVGGLGLGLAGYLLLRHGDWSDEVAR